MINLNRISEDVQIIPYVYRIRCFPRQSPSSLLCRLYYKESCGAHTSPRRGCRGCSNRVSEVATNDDWVRINGKRPYTCTVESVTVKPRKVKAYRPGDPIIAQAGHSPHVQGYRIDCQGKANKRSK